MYTQLNKFRFSGNITEAFQLVVCDYNVCAQQHVLTPTEKADFSLNLFVEPVKKFFYLNANEFMMFDDMVYKMKKEYDSDARRQHLLNQIQNLKLRSHMEYKKIKDDHKRLMDLVNILHKLISQCSSEF